MMARFVWAIAALALASGAQGSTLHYQQRSDAVPATLADPPSQIVVGNCLTCHSLDYITTQPRGKGPQFWRDEVTKMVNVYKAPIAPDDATAIAGVLDRKFGGKD